MPRNGSGAYSRAVTPYAPSTVIASATVNAEMDDIAAALSASLVADGQKVPTANLPMGNFRHTGVGNATARNNYAAYGQVQDGAPLWGGTAGGTANAITITLTPAITAYAAGQRFSFISSAANTGATTINVNGVGAVSVVRADGTTALSAGDIASGDLVSVQYDGTSFRLISATNFDARYARLGAENTFTAAQTIEGAVRVNRTDSVEEGGRVILRRASDNGDSYQLQAFGSGSNPTFRIVRTHGTPASVFSMTDTGAITVSDFLTLNADPTDALHAATKDYVDNAVSAGASVSVVASQVVTSATAQVDLAIPSTGAVFELLLADVLPSANAELRMRTSIDGVTFASGASDYFHPTLGNSSFMSLTNGDSVSSTETGRTYVAGGVIYPGVASTGRFGFVANSSFISASSSNNIGSIGGWRNAVGRQQAIRIYFGTGNILRGVFRLVRVA